jgi:hypothetical protein
MLIEKLRERVAGYTTPGLPTECWSWSKSVLPNGRPRLGVHQDGRTRSYTAARIICAADHGLPLDDSGGRWVARHTCDNVACVNPAHIVPGTYKQNTKDMWDRGRGARGDRRPSAVLNEGLVREIRARCAAGESQRAVGESLGIGQGHVGQVVRGVIWSWVD